MNSTPTNPSYAHAFYSEAVVVFVLLAWTTVAAFDCGGTARGGRIVYSDFFIAGASDASIIAKLFWIGKFRSVDGRSF